MEMSVNHKTKPYILCPRMAVSLMAYIFYRCNANLHNSELSEKMVFVGCCWTVCRNTKTGAKNRSSKAKSIDI